MIKLVLSDMDGTLVPFGRPGVSARTLGAIDGLRAAGVEFGPASGREPVDLSRSFSGRVECFQTGIMSNGKLVYADGELVHKTPLDRDQLEQLVATVTGMDDVAAVVFVPTDQTVGDTRMAATRAELYGIASTSEAVTRAVGSSVPVASSGRLPRGDIFTAAVFVASDDAACVAEARQALEEACPELEFPLPNPHVFDVLPRGWSKASALPILEDALGLRDEQIVFFGDSENDLALMNALPNALCVANGTAEAKAAARAVIGSDVDDGPAQVMEAIAASGGELPPLVA